MAHPIIGQPKPQFMDSNGDPYVSGTIEIQDPGTTDPKTYYPTAADADANTNGATAAITLDAAGKVTNELWGRNNEDYKYILKDSAGTTIDTVDNIQLPGHTRRPRVTFTAADATPSIADGQLFVMSDTGTITDFDDGQVGDIIVVQGFGTGGTIEHNGARIILQEAKDLVLSGSDTVTLAMMVSGIWYELSRSENRSISRSITEATVLTAQDDKATILLNDSLGFALTLPAPIRGFTVKVIVSVAPTSGDHTIVTDSSANIMYGSIINNGAGAQGSAEDTISFVASTSAVGDTVELESDGTSWFFTAISSATGGITAAAT